MRNLDSEQIKNKLGTEISTEEALKDVTPIKWSEEVLNVKRKVVIDNANIEKDKHLKYKTLEAMKLIKENHSLIFELIEEHKKEKNILKYRDYEVYHGSGIINIYDSRTHLQPTMDKEFLNKEWRLVSGGSKKRTEVPEEFLTKQTKEKNDLKNIFGKEVQIYDTFEALDFMKDNPSIEMEWIENKNYGRTRLRFEGNRIVRDYNRTSYTQPELTDEFLSRYWKIGMKKVFKFSGKNNKDVVVIMEEAKIHFEQNNKAIDILEYGMVLKEQFEGDLIDIVASEIEVRKNELYSNGELLFSLSPMTNWGRIGFTLSKEDAKGIIKWACKNKEMAR